MLTEDLHCRVGLTRGLESPARQCNLLLAYPLVRGWVAFSNARA
jgi:hypothetical protein